MSDFNQRSAQRAVRELEDQRRKNAQFMDMLDEVHGAAAVVACDDFSHRAWVLLYAGRRQLRQRRRCHCAALKADQRTRWGWARPGWARIRRWRGGRGKAARARAPTTPVAELRGRIPRHRCPSGCTRPIRRGETRRRDESAQVRGHGAMSRGNRPLTFFISHVSQSIPGVQRWGCHGTGASRGKGARDSRRQVVRKHGGLAPHVAPTTAPWGPRATGSGRCLRSSCGRRLTTCAGLLASVM